MMRKFIFETDWFTDCDDCVALRFLARNLDKEHELLGVNVNAVSPYAYDSIRAFLENENVACPIGLDFQGRYVGETKYQENMSKNSKFSNADAEDSLDFYKRVLEENDGVEIISVGFLSALKRVFTTYPHLIQKVKKLWIMGGNWLKQGGREYNFCGANTPLSVQGSQFVVNELPVEQIYIGSEVGEGVLTGGGLSQEDMLGRAMHDWGAAQGRSSWDPLTVLAAFHDKYPSLFDYVYGQAWVDQSGANYFQEQAGGKHAYLKKTREDRYYQDLINGFLK